MRTVKRFTPFSENEFEYMESYLSHMARQGFLLKYFGVFLSDFTVDKPRERRYRITPKINKSVKADEIAIYEEAGWHYFGKKTGTGLNVFYTDDAEAPEIFTDMKSFRAYAKKYVLAGILAAIVLLLLVTLELLDAGNLFLSYGGILHLIVEVGLPMLVMFTMLLLAVILVVLSFVTRHISMAYRILSAGTIRHELPYKKVLRPHIIAIISVVVLIVGLWVGQGITNQANTNFGVDDATKDYKGTHPVSLEFVDFANWQPVQKAIEKNNYNGNIWYEAEENTNLLFPYKRDVYIDVGELQYRAYYGEAKSEKLAERWITEEILYDTNRKQDPEGIQMDTTMPEGVEYIGFFKDENNGQTIYLRSGKKIERIYYLGEKDIRESIAVFVKDIAQN